MLHGLGFEHYEALGIVNGRIDRMFDASVFFGFFGIVPAIQSTDEVASDAAQAFETAFVEMFSVVVKVSFGGFGTGFLIDEFGADFYETRNVQSIIASEFLESVFGFLLGDFSVFTERLHKFGKVEILEVVGVAVNDVFHN